MEETEMDVTSYTITISTDEYNDTLYMDKDKPVIMSVDVEIIGIDDKY